MASSREHHADRTYSIRELYDYAVASGHHEEAGQLSRYLPEVREIVCDCGQRIFSDETKGMECSSCGVRW